MDWLNSAESLNRLATWLTVATFVAPLLFGVAALVAQNRAKRLEAQVIARLSTELRESQEHLATLMPPDSAVRLLTHLEETGGWAGRPSDFNRHASELLYDKNFAELLTDPTDHYSALLSSGLIAITSVTDHGNRPDGTPDTTVAIVLTPKATAILKMVQGNRRLNPGEPRTRAAR